MSGKVKFKDRLIIAIAPHLARAVIKTLSLTMEITVLHGERVRPFWENDRRMILAFWHGRLLMIPVCYHGSSIKGLISRHKDGEILSRVMGLFGHGTVRGSTTKGGTMAMREMVRTLKECDIAITPDGPQGPKYVVQEGIITLAKLTGVPIVPVTFGAARKKVFGSWDSFNLPYPFCRGAFLWGEPVYVDKVSGTETKRIELEARMREMTEQVDSYVQGNIPATL